MLSKLEILLYGLRQFELEGKDVRCFNFLLFCVEEVAASFGGKSLPSSGVVSLWEERLLTDFADLVYLT